ncbi:hypothetical protein [Niallia sp.]|uniref:hypothetical protein n=1 Tax=Niallia sp. TaxID=2837523 RepID=UPI0028A2324D|nr:hypothetical protein [Niallia sp.]
MKTNNYSVTFTKTASLAFSELYNVDHEYVFIRVQTLLKIQPHKQSDGIANKLGFKFNGLHWTQLGNVIFVYSINEKNKKVRIRACYSNLNRFALKTFYGEHDPL